MNLWVWLKGKYVMDKPSRYKLEMFLEEAFQKKDIFINQFAFYFLS